LRIVSNELFIIQYCHIISACMKYSLTYEVGWCWEWWNWYSNPRLL